MPTPNDEQLYLDATQEVDDGTQNSALWAKAMALAKGDEGKTRYRTSHLGLKNFRTHLQLHHRRRMRSSLSFPFFLAVR